MHVDTLASYIVINATIQKQTSQRLRSNLCYQSAAHACRAASHALNINHDTDRSDITWASNPSPVVAWLPDLVATSGYIAS